MTVKVQYYGMLAEVVGKTTEELDFLLSDQSLILKSFFETKYPKLQKMDYKIAVDLEFAELLYPNTTVKKIALMPPFAGG